MDTVRLNIACRPDVATSSFCQPYPRTELREMACEMGLIDETAETGLIITDIPRTWNMKDKTKLHRIHALFTIVVGMPFLLPLMPVLIRLPLGPVYNGISKIWVGYRFKFRLFPVKLKLRNYVKGVVSFLRATMR